MKINLLTIFLSLSLSVSLSDANAQWTLSAFKGDAVSMLKPVNGYLYVYERNISTFYGGLFRSADSGKTWQNIDSSEFVFIYVNDITYDSAHSDYVLVASSQTGVYYSSDGIAWTNSGTYWSGEAVVYINNQDILSNTNDGPAISTDGGKSWNQSVSGLFAPYYDHSLARIHDTLFLAQQGIPVFISADNGASWKRGDSDMIFFVDCFFEHKNLVYSGLYLAGVAYYQDRHWTIDSVGLPNSNDTWTLCDAGDTLFCGGDKEVWMKTTGKWQNFSKGLPKNNTVHKLLNLNGTLFAGTDSGLYKYDLKNTGSGIAPVQPVNTIQVSPTLTNDIVNIYSDKVPERTEVINVNGQVVLVDKKTSKIDLSKLLDGVYLLRIMLDENTLYTTKIMKQ